MVGKTIEIQDDTNRRFSLSFGSVQVGAGRSVLGIRKIYEGGGSAYVTDSRGVPIAFESGDTLLLPKDHKATAIGMPIGNRPDHQDNSAALRGQLTWQKPFHVGVANKGVEIELIGARVENLVTQTSKLAKPGDLKTPLGRALAFIAKEGEFSVTLPPRHRLALPSEPVPDADLRRNRETALQNTLGVGHLKELWDPRMVGTEKGGRVVQTEPVTVAKPNGAKPGSTLQWLSVGTAPRYGVYAVEGKANINFRDEAGKLRAFFSASRPENENGQDVTRAVEETAAQGARDVKKRADHKETKVVARIGQREIYATDGTLAPKLRNNPRYTEILQEMEEVQKRLIGQAGSANPALGNSWTNITKKMENVMKALKEEKFPLREVRELSEDIAKHHPKEPSKRQSYLKVTRDRLDKAAKSLEALRSSLKAGIDDLSPELAGETRGILATIGVVPADPVTPEALGVMPRVHTQLAKKGTDGGIQWGMAS